MDKLFLIFLISSMGLLISCSGKHHESDSPEDSEIKTNVSTYSEPSLSDLSMKLVHATLDRDTKFNELCRDTNEWSSKFNLAASFMNSFGFQVWLDLETTKGKSMQKILYTDAATEFMRRINDLYSNSEFTLDFHTEDEEEKNIGSINLSDFTPDSSVIRNNSALNLLNAAVTTKTVLNQLNINHAIDPISRASLDKIGLGAFFPN